MLRAHRGIRMRPQTISDVLVRLDEIIDAAERAQVEQARFLIRRALHVFEDCFNDVEARDDSHHFLVAQHDQRRSATIRVGEHLAALHERRFFPDRERQRVEIRLHFRRRDLLVDRVDERAHAALLGEDPHEFPVVIHDRRAEPAVLDQQLRRVVQARVWVQRHRLLRHDVARVR